MDVRNYITRKGMTCDHCVKTVENSLTTLTGVERALVDLDNGFVYIQYDEEKVNLKQMEQAVENSGYDVN